MSSSIDVYAIRLRNLNESDFTKIKNNKKIEHNITSMMKKAVFSLFTSGWSYKTAQP